MWRSDVGRGDAVLELRGVDLRLRAGVPGCTVDVRVLVGVDLRVGAGERLVVAGGRASGKTALLLVAAGLLPACGGRVARADAVLAADAGGVRAVGRRGTAGGGRALLVADDVGAEAELRRLCLVAERLDAALLAAWSAGARLDARAAGALRVRVVHLEAGRLVVGAAAVSSSCADAARGRRVASVAEPS